MLAVTVALQVVMAPATVCIYKRISRRSKNHWALEAITDLTSKGIIAGYDNGKFGFGDVVTREQVAALMYRALKPEAKVIIKIHTLILVQERQCSQRKF